MDISHLCFGALIIATSILTILLTYYNKSMKYWEKRGLPVIPKAVFPFGHMSDLLLNKHSIGEQFANLYHRMRKNNLKHAGAYFITKPIYIPADPKIIKHIIQSDFGYFVNHGGYLNENHDKLGAHLFSLKGEKWRNLRTKLTPTFTPGKMKMMFETLVNCTKELKTIMDNSYEMKTSFDTKEVIARYTTDVIGSCAFGIECNCLKNPDTDFRIYGKKFFQLSLVDFLKFCLTFAIPHKLLDWIKFRLTPNDIEQFFMSVVRETVEYREKNNIIRKDFMHLLLQLKNRGELSDDNLIMGNCKSVGEFKITMDELAAQCYVFFLAGFETSATTSAFALYELAINQKIQCKVRKEIREVLERHGGKMTYEAITDMVYLEKIIQETLRKYPPLPIIFRQCNKDYQIPGTDITIEKGINVMVPILGIQNDPEYYPNPEVFDPDRFNEEHKYKRPNCTWMPFGEGPRICIGMRFGMLQTKVALTTLLQDYKITLNTEKTKLPIAFEKTGIIISVDGGVWLNVEKD